MYGGRKSLLFVLLSVGAVGTLFWITAVYFRRKRRQTASISNIESLKTEEKPKGKSLRASGRVEQIKKEISSHLKSIIVLPDTDINKNLEPNEWDFDGIIDMICN